MHVVKRVANQPSSIGRSVVFDGTDGGLVARKTILVSDLSGAEIDEKDAAKVTINYADARRGTIVLDVAASEVEELARKGVRQARRGRKPKSE